MVEFVKAHRWQAGGLALAGLLAFTIGVLSITWIGTSIRAQDATARLDPSVRHELQEPVTLASQDGVLEVRLTAQQGETSLDTVATPVQNFLLYGYDVIQGTASNGQKTGKNQYPAPTLQVYPGDKLIVHLDNALAGLTIRDLYNPAFKGIIYPEQLTQAPINLHTHGLRVSPKGNSDNVLLHVGAGLTNTYVYDIRKDHPHGAYWYHPHLHQLTSPETYMGLAGILAVGRLDGNIPLVTEKKLPIRNMVLQYNFVFDRKGGGHSLNNPNWSQYVSTLTKPKGDELANGTYRPLLAPVNFLESRKGTEYFTVWWTGPLGVNNNRGRLQFIPSNLQSFEQNPGGAGRTIPADPSMPDYQRDVQFTVNGQFQPIIKSKPGQTEIWVLSNISDMAYMNVQLTETATGRHPKIAILGTDGNPGTVVRYPPTDDGTRLLVPPATRYAIAVTMPEEGDLILEMPPIGEGMKSVSEPGILYTNDGTENPPAILGVVTALPSALSHDDGFFVFPTQVLAKATTEGEHGVTATFAEGQEINAPNNGFFDTTKVTPDLVRRLELDRWVSQQPCQQQRSESLRLRLQQARLSQWTPSSAAAGYRRGVEVLQPQQRFPSDPRARQRLPGNPLLRSHHRFDSWTGAVGSRHGRALTADLARGRRRGRAGGAVLQNPFRGLYRPLRHALPSPQPRRQRVDGAGERHPQCVDLRRGRSRRLGQAGDGASL